MKKLGIPSKKELEDLYLREGATLSSVGRHYGTSHHKVLTWLNEYQIPVKTHKQASTEANNRHRKKNKT